MVEVISPDNRARDRGEKFYEYEQGGVPEYWLVDPQRRFRGVLDILKEWALV